MVRQPSFREIAQQSVTAHDIDTNEGIGDGGRTAHLQDPFSEVIRTKTVEICRTFNTDQRAGKNVYAKICPNADLILVEDDAVFTLPQQDVTLKAAQAWR
jgi:hypothetical protein